MTVIARSIVRVTAAAVLAMVIYATVVVTTVVSAGLRDNGDSADVIVVMGAAQYDGRPSQLLERRLTHALELWKVHQRAPRIAVTGGKQEGDRFTEAQASVQWFIDNGVPENVILREDYGRSTWESLRELSVVLQQQEISRAIVVTSNWHAARSALTLEDLGFSVSTSAISSSGLSLRQWVREGIGVAIGRIIGFDVLFDITG